jgi:cytidyltransferase-like protein
MTKRRYGVVLGRFQPLHVGHMEYLEAAKRKCDRLVVGVTNPDTSLLTHHDADPNRSKQESNPFPYFLRYEMIDASLRDEGWHPDTFAIVPADITDISKVGAFLPDPSQSIVFITIYDAWGDEKAKRLSEISFTVEILWRREMSERVTSGSEIRRRMRQGESWRHLVPAGVAQALDRVGLVKGEDGMVLNLSTKNSDVARR